MMIMTIWWSKATRLLEFSRSVSLDLRTRIFCDQDEEEEDRGIAYSSSWIEKCGMCCKRQKNKKNKYKNIKIQKNKRPKMDFNFVISGLLRYFSWSVKTQLICVDRARYRMSEYFGKKFNLEVYSWHFWKWWTNNNSLWWWHCKWHLGGKEKWTVMIRWPFCFWFANTSRTISDWRGWRRGRGGKTWEGA